MRLRLLLLVTFSLSITVHQTVIAQIEAKGTVFEDANQNGVMDAGEIGISEVAVSNGKEVVLTDSKGEYSISINENDATVFVIKPAGYALPVNDLNQPQFFYIHKPNGSPELEYEGVKPTGVLPDAINFPLLKDESGDSFKVLLFGDPQPYSEQEVDYFDRDIVSELVGASGYEFGITLGDIVGDDLDLYQPYNQSILRIGLPWFNVYGNHDMNFDAETDQYADETFEVTFGPATYSFNEGKAHFIILDDVIYPRTDGESGYIGGFTETQLEFIENDLKHVPKDHLIVLAFHIPIFLPEGGKTFRISDRNRLFDLLKDYPQTLSLSAHTHIQKFHFFDEEEGWQRLSPHIHYNVGTTNGDWWSGVPNDRDVPETLMRDGTPNGYAILNIDGNEFTIDYKVANEPADYVMNMWGPKVVAQNTWHGAELYVNYFLGNEFTSVEYRIADQDEEWRDMAKVAEHDPHVAKLRQKWDLLESLPEDGRRPSNPVESDHLWKMRVPNNLPLGEQVIEIKVTDMFGRTFNESFSYKVAEPGYQR
ncbi:calcineurin-like phosphoesterase C-terminal domain-containing protein [Gracilimonas mengyeensis]|uniref:N terminal of Calcineurin-like phosphoesterase n=1 Tax=Gracilimonas mengyeensis TaxID=1302730 RepID=A0A521F1T9_9BACT|nr:calcineurin-like phosphoesterase family protein [Gracilimonas mengyeensis]SMO90149.1 N terminal of Calcineurin-like phosphoesterase [Gracilimonas mengyeensis]